jgi:hypothetical protein
VVAVSVIAYLPAVDNFFISDDFAMLRYLSVLEKDPLKIVETPSEMFRLMSYVFFWACLQVFGPSPEPWYWSGIALHALASLLIYRLVVAVCGHMGAGWAAAIFFAGYERHQEAVMWISAFNDLILGVNCLLFLVLWEKAVAGGALVKRAYLAAVGLFAVSLFSKEGAVALFPVAVLRLAFLGYSFRQMARYSLPLFLLLSGYVALWLSQADRNFFVADGHYTMGWHFVPVYLRTLARLVSPLLLIVIPLLVVLYRRGPLSGRTLHASRGFSFLFFAALLMMSVLPYSFLTYLDHIPSRNTYFPSIALAGLIGVVFAMLYSELRSERTRRVALLSLTAFVAGNVAYIWLKKEPQFLERSAPTRELVATLNAIDATDTSDVIVCGFPMNPWFGWMAIEDFTQVELKRVVFADHCEETTESVALSWDPQSHSYSRTPSSITD